MMIITVQDDDNIQLFIQYGRLVGPRLRAVHRWRLLSSLVAMATKLLSVYQFSTPWFTSEEGIAEDGQRYMCIRANTVERMVRVTNNIEGNTVRSSTSSQCVSMHKTDRVVWMQSRYLAYRQAGRQAESAVELLFFSPSRT
jgi:hypothetical protein